MTENLNSNTVSLSDFVAKRKEKQEADAKELKQHYESCKNIATYLAPAFYEYLLANDKTPHVRVKRPEVPNQWNVSDNQVKENRVTFNIDPRAVSKFSTKNGVWEFQASFNEVTRVIFFASHLIECVYALEDPKMMLSFVLGVI